MNLNNLNIANITNKIPNIFVSKRIDNTYYKVIYVAENYINDVFTYEFEVIKTKILITYKLITFKGANGFAQKRVKETDECENKIYKKEHRNKRLNDDDIRNLAIKLMSNTY